MNRLDPSLLLERAIAREALRVAVPDGMHSRPDARWPAGLLASMHDDAPVGEPPTPSASPSNH